MCLRNSASLIPVEIRSLPGEPAGETVQQGVEAMLAAVIAAAQNHASLPGKPAGHLDIAGGRQLLEAFEQQRAQVDSIDRFPP